jgi:succinylglutamate desuccinylase
MNNKVAKRFSVAVEVLKQTDNFRLGFSSDTVNFTEFEVGDVLATDKDYQYIVASSGERILFPNEQVAIGQRALVIIRPQDNVEASTL